MRYPVQVWPEVDGTDDLGNPTRGPGPTPLTLYARHLYPTQSSDLDVAGEQTYEPYTGIFRTFPAGPYARVRFARPKTGLVTEWTVDGAPARHGGSPATAHVTVRFKAVSGEGVHDPD